MADAALTNNPWFALGSSLLSGAVAVVISTLYYRHFELRRIKVDCFRRLLGARYAITPDQHSPGAVETFFFALNEAALIFSGVPAVISALKTLHADLPRSERLHDNVVNLFRAMADHLGLSREELQDSFFLMPFKPPS
ncbi:MAG TPA: hypothetical protein VIS96_07195 [Terrimicrobiaceae bacterium]